MCTQKAPYDYSEQLYERYEAAFNQYINAKVLPTLVEKKGEYMLKSLVARWENHKIMVIRVMMKFEDNNERAGSILIGDARWKLVNRKVDPVDV